MSWARGVTIKADWLAKDVLTATDAQCRFLSISPPHLPWEFCVFIGSWLNLGFALWHRLLPGDSAYSSAACREPSSSFHPSFQLYPKRGDQKNNEEGSQREVIISFPIILFLVFYSQNVKKTTTLQQLPLSKKNTNLNPVIEAGLWIFQF